MNAKEILYGEFINSRKIKKVIIVSVILVALLNTPLFQLFINYLRSFFNTQLSLFSIFDYSFVLFGKFSVGMIWIIFAVWILIWFTNKDRGY